MELTKFMKKCTCGRVHTHITNSRGIQWIDEEMGIGLHVWNCECGTTLATPINKETENWYESNSLRRRVG